MNAIESARELVERQARRIKEDSRETEGRPSPISLLELQIAFWSDTLDQLRMLHQEQLQRIVRAECYVGTDLLKLDSYAPKTWHFRLQPRDTLKTKLLHLDAERRRWMAAHDRDVRDVQIKLLELLVQHGLLQD